MAEEEDESLDGLEAEQLVALTVRASSRTKGVKLDIDGKPAGTLTVSTRVAPGKHKLHFSDGESVDLTCVMSVGEGGRTMEFDAKKGECPK
ncbi:MAG: hypothetical protein ACOZNI_08770 [Myxococcota bacterium]